MSPAHAIASNAARAPDEVWATVHGQPACEIGDMLSVDRNAGAAERLLIAAPTTAPNNACSAIRVAPPWRPRRETKNRHGGSLSGEHGDGQARGELLPAMFDREIIRAFEEFKRIWDPHWKMNPGKLVAPFRADENLRRGAKRADARSVCPVRDCVAGARSTITACCIWRSGSYAC